MDLQIEEVISTLNNDIKDVPVFWSPAVYKSEVVLVYEKPTPAGDSRNSKFATAQILKTKKNELSTKKQYRKYRNDNIEAHGKNVAHLVSLHTIIPSIGI